MDARQQIIRELRSQLGLLVDEIDIVTNQLVMEYRELINFNNNNNNNYNINNYYYENAQGDIAPVLVNLDQMHNQQQQQQQWYEGMDDLGAADLDNERPILDHLQQQQQQEQWEDDLDVLMPALTTCMSGWCGAHTPLITLDVLLLPEEPQQQQQQQQPEWRLHPVAAAWETPRRRPPFERPVPMRSPTPSAPQSPPLDDEQQQQQPPQQQQLTATVTADGPPNFAAQCALCQGDHGNDCDVVVRGNNCVCVALCTDCARDGWQQLVNMSAINAQTAMEENAHPFTGEPRNDAESYRNWVEAHDARPRCLQCHAQRVDFLFPVARPRRSTRMQKTRRCLFCCES
ncbi:hypothetical protein GPALN_016214 [Globodera pallida]|nr:hypothetical protein GPALN_016214 [Globodera pallida]